MHLYGAVRLTPMKVGSAPKQPMDAPSHNETDRPSNPKEDRLAGGPA